MSHRTDILHYVELCLERSRDCLLDVHIETPSASQQKQRRINPKVEMERAKQAILFLIPHISRWRSLVIDVAYTFAAETLLWELQSSAGSLKLLFARSVHSQGSLDLSKRARRRLLDSVSTRGGWIFQESFSAPKLQRMAFNRVLTQQTIAPLIPHHFPALRHLRIVHAHYIQVLSPFVCDFTSLQTLDLNDCIVGFRVGQRLKLPNLADLSFNGQWTHPALFLSNCSMPRLSRLTLSSTDWSHLPFFSRTPVAFDMEVEFPLLHTLILKNIPIVHIDPTNGNINFCQRLYMQCSAKWRFALEAWSKPRNGRWECPALKRLTVVSEKELEEDYIRRLVEARYEASQETGADDGSLDGPVALSRLHLKTRYIVADERLAWYISHVPEFEWTQLGPRREACDTQTPKKSRRGSRMFVF